VLIVVDNESLPASADSDVKSAIGGLLDGLAAGDRVAFSTAPTDTAQVGFGTPMTTVRERVGAIQGQRTASVTTGQDVCRTTQTLSLLNTLVRGLTANTTPTSVVFIASGLSDAGSEGSSTTGGTCEVVQGQYQTIADSAAEARANVYVVQGDPGTMGRNNGLETLAGVTGAGQVMRVTGDGFAPRVLAEASNYWVATIAPDQADRVGQAQRLEVRTKRDGVTIHARAAAAVSRVAPAAAAKPGTTSPKDMISSTAQFTDLQLRAAAIVQRGAGDKFNVLIQAEPVDPTVKINSMRVGYFDQNNKGGSLDSPKAQSYPITTAFAVAPGQYRVRVAATDDSGKSGAVDVMMNAGLTDAGPLKVSSLMVGAPMANKGMRPQLTFSNEESVLIFMELYGQLTAGISVKFELAKSDTGPALETFAPSGGAPTNEPDKLQVFAQIPIAKLEPGDYVIRALVQMEGQPEGKVLKTIRKLAK
jgi:hypothetical protein